MAYNGLLGTASNKTAGTSLAITISSTSLAVDDDVFIAFASDDAGSSHSVSHTGTASITWTLEGSVTNTGNVRSYLFRGHVTAAGTITGATVSWTSNITAKVAVAGHYSGVGTRYTTATVTGSGNPVLFTCATKPVSAGDIIIGTAGTETASLSANWSGSGQFAGLAQARGTDFTIGQGDTSNIKGSLCDSFPNFSSSSSSDFIWNNTNQGDGAGFAGFYSPAATGDNHTVTPSDTITMSDSLTGKAIGLGKADTITLSDATSRVWNALLSRADTITLSDAAGKAFGKPAADTITLSDNATVLLILVLQLADTITLSDATAKAAGVARADTVTLSDAVQRAWTALRSLSDTVTLTDAVGKGLAVALADTLATSDTLGKADAKALADTVTLADATAKTYGISRQDAVTLTDGATKALGLGPADTVTLSDVIAKVAAISRADSISLTDVIDVDLIPEGGPGLTLELSDTITLTDVIVKSLGMSRADIVQLADSTARALNGLFIEDGGGAVDFRQIILNRFGIY